MPNDDVLKDQTSGAPIEDQAVFDLMSESEGESETPTEESNSQDESEEEAEGSEEQKDDEESQSSDKSDDDSKPDEEKEDTGNKDGESDDEEEEGDEKEDEDEEGAENDEPFAKIGDQDFKTKEDLISFTKSQAGFNRLVVGNLKKVHPEWFEEGKLKAERITASQKKDVKEGKEVLDKVQQDAEAGKDVTLSDADKTKLRSLGFVFQEDIKPIKESVEKQEDDELNQWFTNHPGSETYTEEINELAGEGKLSLDEAWDVVRKRHKLPDPEEDKGDKTYEQGKKDGKKKKSLDSTSSSAPGGKGGVAPEKQGEEDVMDVILNTGGL